MTISEKMILSDSMIYMDVHNRQEPTAIVGSFCLGQGEGKQGNAYTEDASEKSDNREGKCRRS